MRSLTHILYHTYRTGAHGWQQHQGQGLCWCASVTSCRTGVHKRTHTFYKYALHHTGEHRWQQHRGKGECAGVVLQGRRP